MPLFIVCASCAFLSTLSLRRATLTDDVSTGGKIFLSTLSLRRATTGILLGLTSHKRISIHALLAESDPEGPAKLPKLIDFYPRSPCGERLEEVSGDTWQRDFYPRSPCGERPYQQGERQANQSISIHALLAESDAKRWNSTERPIISIHALLAESD